MIKIIAMVKRKSGITAEEFSRYWYDEHAPFFRTMIPEALIAEKKGYVQNHVVRLASGREPPFDGVAEICFDNLESFRRWNEWYFSDDAKPLRDDEENFMDRSKAIIVVAEERVVIP